MAGGGADDVAVVAAKTHVGGEGAPGGVAPCELPPGEGLPDIPYGAVGAQAGVCARDGLVEGCEPRGRGHQLEHLGQAAVESRVGGDAWQRAASVIFLKHGLDFGEYPYQRLAACLGGAEAEIGVAFGIGDDVVTSELPQVGVADAGPTHYYIQVAHSAEQGRLQGEDGDMA